MTTIPLIYVPGLQPEFAPQGLPARTRFVSPGLPGTQGDLFWLPDGLPFSVAEARGCLNELMALGDQFRNTRDLVTLALQPEEGARSRNAEFRAEMAELDRFAATGVLDAASGIADDGDGRNGMTDAKVRASAVAAQKTLILAWNLETRVRELQSLEATLAERAGNFRNVLGVDDEDLADLPGMQAAVSGLPGNAGELTRLAWRTVLDAVLRFLPREAVLVTGDAGMADALRELAPMTDIDADLSGEGALAGMFRVPAWRLLGHASVPADRAWLDRELRVLLVSGTDVAP